MCVNDVLCHCAAPIAFVDYYVTGRLKKDRAREVVASIARACIGPSRMCVGDVLIGLPSSGLHSNGFSLVRKIFKMNDVSYKDPTPWNPKETFGEVLLTGTRLYVRSVFPLLKEGLVKGCAHITGGGIEENLPRVLDNDSQLSMEVDAASWKKPEIFNWLAGMGPVESSMMLRTFNCGIGMVLVVAASKTDEVIQRLQESGEHAVHIGRVVRRQGSSLLNFTNLNDAFSSKYVQPPKPKIKVGILISGNGSNMVKLIESSRTPSSNCE
ncbi:putative phosphoribosylformylglycinamidine cyclo-ligase, partial [Cooperia oncophora]